MPEPISTTGANTAAVSMGLIALLTGWLGQIGADVMLVILASIAGTSIALLNAPNHDSKKAVTMLVVGIIVSFSFAWFIASLLSDSVPVSSQVYLPSTIAFVLSFGSNRISEILNLVIDKLTEKLGVKS
jgi:hypothetical protein